MTVWENLMSLLETRKDLTPEERTAKAESLLDEFNIGRVRDTKGGALSGGERRRVEIARSLTMDPASSFSMNRLQALIRSLSKISRASSFT